MDGLPFTNVPVRAQRVDDLDGVNILVDNQRLRQPQRSLKKSCSAAEYPKQRREVSAISDKPRHGIEPAAILPEGHAGLSRVNSVSTTSSQSNKGAGAKHPRVLGARPSNRSEAALLAAELSQKLEAAPKRNFRSEKVVYDAVFAAVCEQVSVHCSERGEVLERLRQFYTRSSDTTARVAESAVRAEIGSRVAELELQVADLEKEVAHLRTRQMNDDAEVMVMRLFRELPARKQVRTLGLLYAENGRMLMMKADDNSERLSTVEQAQTINQLMLTHTPDERAALISALVALAPAREQYKQLRCLLGAMPMADQIKMSMAILQPEQHRRIMLGIFDSACDEHEKATLLLDALHTMQMSKQTITLSHVLSAIRPDDLLATLRVVVGGMPITNAMPFVAEIVSMLEGPSSARSVMQWATAAVAKQKLAAPTAAAEAEATKALTRDSGKKQVKADAKAEAIWKAGTGVEDTRQKRRSRERGGRGSLVGTNAPSEAVLGATAPPPADALEPPEHLVSLTSELLQFALIEVRDS